MDRGKITVGILAGGKSTRMGKDKALLKWGEETFLEHIEKELSPLGKLFIATRKALVQPAGVNLGDCEALYDAYTDCGPLAGIVNVLKASPTPWSFICAVDMPMISRELVEYLYEFCSSDYDCVCITVGKQPQPLCALYRKAILPLLEEQIALGHYRLRDILPKVRTKYVDIAKSCFSEECLANINTPAEYARLIHNAPVVFCVSGLKNSGKTTLICNLLPFFRQEGYEVAVIKHDGHDFAIDYPHTDTASFSAAGAKQSIIFSEAKYAVMGKGSSDITKLLSYCRDCDFVIIEGLKASGYPKIEVLGEFNNHGTVCEPQTVFAYVTDSADIGEMLSPVFRRNELEKLYQHILRVLAKN